MVEFQGQAGRRPLILGVGMHLGVGKAACALVLVLLSESVLVKKVLC